MAEIKWIKIATNIFDDEKLLLIENLPEADAIIVIWFKLLCMAGKQNNNGVFMLNDRIAYTEEMLATIFRKPLNVVRLALTTFEQYGMIEVIDNVITIPNWEKHQNVEKLETLKEQTRLRVAKHREKQKEKLIGLVDKCVYCGEKGDTIDHVIPKSKGGLDIPENTVCCCLHCNLEKNNYDVTKFLNDRLLKKEKVNIESILHNMVLKKYLDFDYQKQKFVTQNVTLRNALEEDKEEDKNKNIIIDIVEYLNLKTKSSYRASSDKTKRVINARLNEGFNLDDFKKVIDIKCTQWLGDEKMEQYLRPETLFGTKFESYLNTKLPNQKVNECDEYDELR